MQLTPQRNSTARLFLHFKPKLFANKNCRFCVIWYGFKELWQRCLKMGRFVTASAFAVWKAGAHNSDKLQEEVAQLNEEAPCPWDPQTCFWLTSVGCTNNSTMRYLQTCALLVRVLCLVMLARKRRTRWPLGVVGPLVASSRSCCSAAHWRTRKSIARGVVNIFSMQLQLDSFCCLCTPEDCRHCWKMLKDFSLRNL